jgi:hypothetical protein
VEIVLRRASHLRGPPPGHREEDRTRGRACNGIHRSDVRSSSAWGWQATCDFQLAESLIDEPFAEEPELEALVLRYLAALGPASVADAQTFTGIKGLAPTFERLRPRLSTFRDERGALLFDVPDAPRPDPETPAPVRFLPDFDNVVLGHADRRRAVAERHSKYVYLPGLAVARTYLVDGFVAGAWKVETAKKVATIVIEPFDPVAKASRAALEEEADRLVRFLEPGVSQYDVRFEKPKA